MTTTSKRTKRSTSTSPLSGMPPEVAAILQQRGNLPPAAVDSIEPAKTADAALAKLEAMTAELAECTGINPTSLTKHSEVKAAVADITAPAPATAPVVEKAPAPTADRTVRLPQRPNPNARFIELPDAVAEFVQQNVQTVDRGVSTNFTDAASYYAAHHDLTQLIQKLPASVPAPLGWSISSSGAVDVRDILTAANAARHPEMLTDLIRWSMTVQQANAASDARSALSGLETRGKAADDRLKAGTCSSMLNRFRALSSLMQTQAFAGRPELLTEMLKEDWKWLKQGVAYRTPLAELTGTPLIDAGIIPAAFCNGSPAEFVQQLQTSLIDGAAVSAPFLTTDSNSIALDRKPVTAWLRCTRPLADADSPVIVMFGYQEVHGTSEISSGGVSEGWRDVTVLTLEHSPDGCVVKRGQNPGSALFAVASAAADVLLQI